MLDSKNSTKSEKLSCTNKVKTDNTLPRATVMDSSSLLRLLGRRMPPAEEHLMEWPTSWRQSVYFFLTSSDLSSALRSFLLFWKWWGAVPMYHWTGSNNAWWKNTSGKCRPPSRAWMDLFVQNHLLCSESVEAIYGTASPEKVFPMYVSPRKT